MSLTETLNVHTKKPFPALCKNCKSYGHDYRRCPEPINSYGILCYRKNPISNRLEYLIVCRQSSFAFTEFISGRFPQNETPYISLMLHRMTKFEQDLLLRCTDFRELWEYLWGINVDSHQRIYESCLNKYNRLKDDLPKLIQESKTSFTDPEWGFPKGKLHSRETTFQCAQREFSEETGISSSLLTVQTDIGNSGVVIEHFENVDGLTYKMIYYVCECSATDLRPPTVDVTCREQAPEISEIKWASFEECILRFRGYYTQKLSTLVKVHKHLSG